MTKFHIGDILSITTGKMVSPSGMIGIRRILEYMTGENLHPCQWPRAMRVCAPRLLEQHPQLKTVETIDNEISESSYKLWLIEQIVMYGRELSVSPLPKDAYQPMHPIEEAIWVKGSAEGIYVAEVDES